MRTDGVVADEALPDKAVRERVRDVAGRLAGPVGKGEDAVAVGVEGREEACGGLGGVAEAQHRSLKVREGHGAGARGVQLGEHGEEIRRRDLVAPASRVQGCVY